MIIVMLLNLLYIVLPFCLSLQRLELSGLRLQPRSNSATSLICCSVWHKYLCLVIRLKGFSLLNWYVIKSFLMYKYISRDNWNNERHKSRTALVKQEAYYCRLRKSLIFQLTSVESCAKTQTGHERWNFQKVLFLYLGLCHGPPAFHGPIYFLAT